ncbi:uncharacterized protein [Nicotiana tomentosiformis]|uniref:uncharacterized protein n=1 Tax=Nicotiana tomentosiformis TaxID=4098 RepID=UPI00388CEC40
MRSLEFIPAEERPLAMDVQALDNKLAGLDISDSSKFLSCVCSWSSLFERIKARMYEDPHLVVLKDTVQYGGAKEVNVDGLRELILEEAHSSWYAIHLGAKMMYHDLKKHYWWRRINKYIVGHVAHCLNYQQVMYEHQRLGGSL